jgi:preprotein translocase subunit SecG
MIPLVVVLHVIASLTLVLFILLHAGRGGGLSDMFGGGMSTTLGGSTVVERNLDRLTVGAATMFGATSVILALLLAPKTGS